MTTIPETLTTVQYTERLRQALQRDTARRAKRLHRAAYHRSTTRTPERKARDVAESITLKRDEGRSWSWADYGLDQNTAMQALVLAALEEL